jgi:hypothetical protein
MDAELQRLRDDNADLRRRVGEFANIEAAKKKADARVEQLEQRVCGVYMYSCLALMQPCEYADGGDDTGEDFAKGKRTECYI